jgi:four helix bundle protein
MRRAAISVPSNIAEGFGRQSTGDYCRFLSISRGSLLELETQVILCKRLSYITSENADTILNEIEQVAKMLSVLITKVRC